MDKAIKSFERHLRWLRPKALEFFIDKKYAHITLVVVSDVFEDMKITDRYNKVYTFALDRLFYKLKSINSLDIHPLTTNEFLLFKEVYGKKYVKYIAEHQLYRSVGESTYLNH